MKKLIGLISAVSIAALISFSNFTLADEKDENEKENIEQAEDHNSARSNVSTKKDPGDEEGERGNSRPLKQQGRVLLDSDSNEGEGDDIPKGSGDPMKGLLGGKGTPCKPCDVPFGGTVNTGDDDEDEAGKEKDLPEQASDKAREATSKEKKKDQKEKKKDKKK